MKKLLALLLLVSAFSLSAQDYITGTIIYAGNGQIIVGTDTLTFAGFQQLINDYNTGSLGGSGGSATLNGSRPITLNVDGLSGINPGTNDVAQWLETVFYPSEPPTANLTLTYAGSTHGNTRTIEYDGGTTQEATANWTAGRQATTTELASITINGQAQSFTTPAAGNSINGTHGVSWPSNSNTSINLVVTTSDAKTASDNINIQYRWKRYFGFTTDPPSTSDDILALAGQEFATSKSKSYSTASPSGSQYLVYAYPVSFGELAGITVNGFPSLASFTQSTITFTNASGGTTDYYIYTSNNTFSNSASVAYE